jgi:cytoskeleton-associated protein 5
MQNTDQDDEDMRDILDDGGHGRDPMGDDEDNLLLDHEEEEENEVDELSTNISQLKFGDLSKRVDALVCINEQITSIDENKANLERNADELISAFTHVMKEIFDKPLPEIPLRFAKYFITIIHKACTYNAIMSVVQRHKVFELTEQLLTRLLIDNLDKVGEQGEGQMIIKNLNSSMLRLLENCDHTYIFCVLFDLLKKYRNYSRMPKLPGLIIKCLLKLSKIIEKIIDKLDMDQILLSIHEYLIEIDHDNKS